MFLINYFELRAEHTELAARQIEVTKELNVLNKNILEYRTKQKDQLSGQPMVRLPKMFRSIQQEGKEVQDAQKEDEHKKCVASEES